MKKYYRFFRRENARMYILALLIAGVVAEAMYTIKSPSVPFLVPYENGAWMRPNWSTSLVAMYGDVESFCYYRKLFQVIRQSSDIRVDVAAYRNAEVFLDGNPLPMSKTNSWKEQRHLTLPYQLLTKGSHELKLRITNRMGPPLCHVSSDLPMLSEFRGWEFSEDGLNWKPALPCNEVMHVGLGEKFPTVAEGVRHSLFPLLSIGTFVFIMTVLRPRYVVKIITPNSVRLIVLLMWLILGINDMVKLPTYLGFDADDHVKYIAYLLQYHRLPAASEGVQMFQPPLYYAVSAIVYWLASTVFSSGISLVLTKIVSLGCGLLLVEITYRTLSELFPDRNDLQIYGLLVGGLLPMNFYMCQYYGNEPLAAVLTAMVLLLSIRMFRGIESAQTSDVIILGATTGVAVLAKVTPMLLIPLICAYIMVLPGQKRPSEFHSRVRTAGLFLVTTAVLCGWFFIRNWLTFGKPFIGGWDAARNIFWWQDPGYRTLRDFYAFGESLRQPVYAAFYSFADGVYSTFWNDGYLSGMAIFNAKPDWNYYLLGAGTALSVVPAFAILAGVAITFWRTGKDDWWRQSFLLLSIAVYFIALVHLYVTLPIFSTAKASYTMGLTPCYAVMAALGAGFITRNKYVGSLFAAVVVAWGMTTYLGFFVT